MESTGKSYRILIGDDDLPSLRLIKKQLELLGFTGVDTAGSAAEVEQMLQKQPYDIVILDWIMPGKNGMILMQEAKARKENARTAFAFLSAEAHEHKVKEALDAGAVAYIVKPATQTDLREKMARIVSFLDTAAKT
jgi:two-component system, OmpR family, manganese sensing response regulator